MMYLRRMSKAAFVVAFDGPGVEDGTIDVRDLAPALLALGHTIDAANRAIYGDAHPARVQAKAVSAGCFEVSLDVVLSGWTAIKDLLMSDDAQAASALLGWLGVFTATGGGLIALYRHLHGKLPDKVEQEANSVTITIDDRSLTVPFEVLRLYQDINVNRAVGQLLDTFDNERIHKIEFRRFPGAAPEQVITSSDREAFALPPPRDETVVDDTRKMALSIRSLAFQEGNKWRLFDGQNVITATIEDKEFLGRIDRSEIRFAKSDILICSVQSVQKQGVDGLKTEHFVKKVLEHRPAPSQIDLFTGLNEPSNSRHRR